MKLTESAAILLASTKSSRSSLGERLGNWGMATQATLASAFTKAAIRFNVSESDYLVLGTQGIATFEALAYRVPKQEDLEDILRNHLLTNAAYKSGDGAVQVFDRDPPLGWAEYKVSEDAGALRKLWAMAREVCKAEIESLTTGDTETPRAKVGVANSLAMEATAIREGMPTPTSDAERPSLYTLSKVTKSLVPPGANYEHLSWENFISMEEEGVLTRQNKMPKNRPELVISNAKVAVKEKTEDGDPPGSMIQGGDSMRRTLELRARAFAMVEAAPYKVYRSLHDRYLSKLESSVPDGMRVPTINELRRFDRLLHEEILRWLSRNVGQLSEAIQYYLDHDEQALWRLVDPVVSTLPDQGVEAKRGTKRGLEEKKEEKPGEDIQDREAPPKTPKLKKRLVCSKKHTPLCKLPEGFRAKQREAEKKKKAEAKAKAGK